MVKIIHILQLIGYIIGILILLSPIFVTKEVGNTWFYAKAIFIGYLLCVISSIRWELFFKK